MRPHVCVRAHTRSKAKVSPVLRASTQGRAGPWRINFSRIFHLLGVGKESCCHCQIPEQYVCPLQNRFKSSEGEEFVEKD